VAAGGDSPGGWDFFVSYAQADRAWAEWIAWILEEDGHGVLVQAWDFVPGTNWVQGMQAGTRDAARTIAVLSRDYLESVYGGAEWQVVFERAARPVPRCQIRQLPAPAKRHHHRRLLSQNGVAWLSKVV